MGTHIEDFDGKWKFYIDAGRAQAISPQYFPNAGSTTHPQVAQKFPAKPSAPFPFSGASGGSMTPAAFSYWLTSKTLPLRRQTAFESLTRLRIDDWLLPLDAFQALVSRRAGETTGWADLVRHAVRGAIKVVVRNDSAGLRFQTLDLADREQPPTVAWPGCHARVLLPDDIRPSDDDVRHAWLIADYGVSVFVLDPMLASDGAPSITKLTAATRALPRNKELAVGLSTRFLPGQVFDTIVLTFDLDNFPEGLATAFRGLEQELVRPREPYAAATFQAIRQILDDAATLIRQHRLDHIVYREPCVIVPAPNGQAPTTTKPAHS